MLRSCTSVLPPGFHLPGSRNRQGETVFPRTASLALQALHEGYGVGRRAEQ
jgi:hypothetical protein